ncbi:MAG: hypothetical protein GXP08_18135 [Gammaproteobacteria bacterium]|nr:hypothetical protein [Gammaproteobacteria bacterium]
MELIYSSPNDNQIQQLQEMLSGQGIPSTVIRKSLQKNENKVIGYSFTELWLSNELQYQRAKSIISRFETKKIKDAINSNRLHWEDETDNQAWVQRCPQQSGYIERSATQTHTTNKTTHPHPPVTPIGDALMLEFIKKWFHPIRFSQTKPSNCHASCLAYLSSLNVSDTTRQKSRLSIDAFQPYWIHQSRKCTYKSSAGMTFKSHALRNSLNG